MIDKIHISFPNKFKISDKARFKRVPSTIDEGTVEIIYPNDCLYSTDEDRVVDNNNLLFFSGVDQSSYPAPRTIIIGLQVGF